MKVLVSFIVVSRGVFYGLEIASFFVIIMLGYLLRVVLKVYDFNLNAEIDFEDICS